MAADLGVFRGVIRGKIIELEKDPGLQEGDPVEVRLKLNLRQVKACVGQPVTGTSQV